MKMSKSVIDASDFSKICRLCLGSKRSLVEIYPAKRRVSSPVPLSDKIITCASINMFPGDGLPEKICLRCVQTVNSSYTLRMQAEKADAELREILLRLEPVAEANSNRLEANVCKSEPDAAACDEDVNGQTQIQDAISIEIMDVCKPKFEDINDVTGIAIEDCTEDVGNNEDAEPSDTNEDEPVPKMARYSSAAAHFAFSLLSKQAGLTITKSPTSRRMGLGSKSAKMKSSAGETEISELTARRSLIAQKIQELGKKMEGDKYYCQECKIFIGTAYFYNHVKFVHVKVRDHLCEDCGYRAQTGHILRQHIDAVHTDHTYPCDICQRKFRSLKSARDHQRSVHIQAKERAHICQFCGKGFFTAYYLRNHIRTHTNETPYHCQYCSRAFSFKWPCTTHERLHTGVKPYKCSYADCQEAFTQNCVRKNHEYRAHGNEEFNPKNRKPREGNLREKKKSKVKIVPTDLLAVSMSSETSVSTPLS